MAEPWEISAEEIATWIPINSAWHKVGDLMGHEIGSDALGARLQAGELCAAAESAVSKDETFKLVRIAQSHWRPNWVRGVRSSFWISGQVQLPIERQQTVHSYGDPREITYFGIRVDPIGLARMFPDNQESEARTSLGGGAASSALPAAPHAGGRPKKPWWDDLWVEMFRQIWVGELRPLTQADIERAMLTWAESQGQKLSESSVKTPARKLFAAHTNEGKN